jgi:CDP-diacylglycerol pyrophosphatase
MSAKNKLREELEKYKALAHESEMHRLKLAAYLLAVVQKFGGTLVLPKQDFQLVTRDWALAERIDEEAQTVTLRAMVKKPQAPSHGR